MCVYKTEAGPVMLQDEGYEEEQWRTEAKKKKIQISVSYESCESQFKELEANGKSYTVLLSRGENKAAIKKTH